jgi:stalled ribosome alternative rescue factor ArfA
MQMPQIATPDTDKFQIPIPYPNNPEKSLVIQAEIVRILDPLLTTDTHGWTPIFYLFLICVHLWFQKLTHAFQTEIKQVVDWNLVDKEAYLSAMQRSVIKDVEIKALLKQPLGNIDRADFSCKVVKFRK